MNQNLVYREGCISDLQLLKELSILSYQEFSKVLSLDNWQTMSNNMNNEEVLSALIIQSKTFVCEIDNLIVGMAYLVPKGNPTPIYPAEWSYIRMVGVHPDYRGRGIGKKLTVMCVEVAKETNEKTIALHTSEIMDAARHIYEDIGFEICQDIGLLFGVKYWLYKLDL